MDKYIILTCINLFQQKNILYCKKFRTWKLFILYENYISYRILLQMISMNMKFVMEFLNLDTIMFH